ncbi:hypothetical protein EJP77_15390 [Paenibacillus zeisoli]|uniref:Uncharacterized protein n=1 Tax=Paenibacillus zeisoli TaxID=2496267 RepID=A0A3S1D494_9BACL|nr:hypothetical protein EJP77_15390 [Paenibacillus zeisoli]
MSYICSLCNGLFTLSLACPACSQPLEDSGRLEDYKGPYSPYNSADQYYGATYLQSSCEHIVSCPHCGEQYIYQVDLSLT